MMDRNVLVANPGFRRSWPSISLPFSLVATEHMAPFHIRTRDPAGGGHDHHEEFRRP